MANRKDLRNWLIQALKANNGSASVIKVCRYVWENYELRRSGELFFTGSYDIRWVATHLRKEDVMRAVELSPKGIWELAI